MSHASNLKAITMVLLMCAALSIILCSLGGCAIPDGACDTRDVASLVAESFVKNDDTFKAKFDCRHSGYGDRTGKILAQVITPHEAEITVVNCQVKSAVMDSKWNMLTEKPI